MRRTVRRQINILTFNEISCHNKSYKYSCPLPYFASDADSSYQKYVRKYIWIWHRFISRVFLPRQLLKWFAAKMRRSQTKNAIVLSVYL